MIKKKECLNMAYWLRKQRDKTHAQHHHPGSIFHFSGKENALFNAKGAQALIRAQIRACAGPEAQETKYIEEKLVSAGQK